LDSSTLGSLCMAFPGNCKLQWCRRLTVMLRQLYLSSARCHHSMGWHSRDSDIQQLVLHCNTARCQCADALLEAVAVIHTIILPQRWHVIRRGGRFSPVMGVPHRCRLAKWLSLTSRSARQMLTPAFMPPPMPICITVSLRCLGFRFGVLGFRVQGCHWASHLAPFAVSWPGFSNKVRRWQ